MIDFLGGELKWRERPHFTSRHREEQKKCIFSCGIQHVVLRSQSPFATIPPPEIEIIGTAIENDTPSLPTQRSREMASLRLATKANYVINDLVEAETSGTSGMESGSLQRYVCQYAHHLTILF